MGGRTSIPLYVKWICKTYLNRLFSGLKETTGRFCHDQLREKAPMLMRTFSGYSERELCLSVLEFAQRLWIS